MSRKDFSLILESGNDWQITMPFSASTREYISFHGLMDGEGEIFLL
ncbi:MAG: hypothetical protein QMB16_07255 [Paracoccaceae bacterium]|jgi:hypothetical protein